ncbi:MAG: catalytic domain protein [Gammaproteobacteria bacterium]|jgi:putative endonuclease|nr:catalytic domain protein [Gammaproteobacteria bacterium]
MKKTYYFVYILLCNNGSYYTGYTTELVRRYQEHLQGTAKCKYTRSFKPVSIVQSWQVEDKGTALQIEKFIKKLNKTQKQQLILFPDKLKIYFAIARVFIPCLP